MDPARMIVAIVVIVAVTTTFRTVFATFFSRRAYRAEDHATASLADSRLSRLEQAVDAIAVEVERISEGPRFATRLLSEQARQSSKLSRELTNTPT